jgi:hypothetical protein
MILERSGERVNLSSGSIQVAGTPSVVQNKQLKAQLAGGLWLNPRLRPGPEKPFKAAVPEALDHCVKGNDTSYIGQGRLLGQLGGF